MMVKIFDVFEFFDVAKYYESANLLIASCPVHEGDNETAFNINIDTDDDEFYGRWFCNTKRCHCQKTSNDILSLVWLLLDKKYNKEHNFIEVVQFCENFCSDIHIDSVICSHKSLTAIDKLIKANSKQSNDVRRITRTTVRKHLIFPAAYYLNRGYLETTLDLFDVGLCVRQDSPMYQRVVFPVYDENDQYMVGCIGRTVINDHKKWINQKGFNKSNFLYNYGKAIERIRETETIILVEGQGDVLRLWEAGIKNAVGIFGAKISDSQEFLIQKTGVTNIVLMADNDAAGRECNRDIHDRLQYLFNIFTVDVPKKDIGDMTVDEINFTIKPQLEGRF